MMHCLSLKKEGNVASIDIRSEVNEVENPFALANEFAYVWNKINLDPEIYVVVLKGAEALAFDAASKNQFSHKKKR